MTDERFCELETEITGEKIDDITQLSMATFNGIELKEYVEHFIKEETIKLKEQNKEMLDVLKRLMLSEYNCAMYDKCYKTDYECIYKSDCRFLKTGDLINKIEFNNDN